jgi:hypothetical protein
MTAQTQQAEIDPIPGPKTGGNGAVPYMTQTQVGTIGEVTVAAQLMLASGGRLSPFLPFADDDGIDLIVYDKVTGVSLPVQVKARTSAKLGKSDTILFDVRRKTFSEHADSFLLAILLDMSGGLIRRAWLIPMSELGKVARVNTEKLSITPSAKDGSNDRYTPYRCSDMAAVAERMARHLDTRSIAASPA